MSYRPGDQRSPAAVAAAVAAVLAAARSLVAAVARAAPWRRSALIGRAVFADSREVLRPRWPETSVLHAFLLSTTISDVIVNN